MARGGADATRVSGAGDGEAAGATAEEAIQSTRNTASGATGTAGFAMRHSVIAPATCKLTIKASKNPRADKGMAASAPPGA